MELLNSLYEAIFVKPVKECPYFPKGLDSFGVMLKGKSLERFPNYDKQFENCFLVNNFDMEIEVIGDSLSGKKCVHFINRTTTAPLRPENYEKLNITDIQLSLVSGLGEKRLKKAIKYYKSLKLKTHFLPKKLLEFNKRDFGKEYARKYPNTGIIAIIYSLEILQPKVLWLIGLDFYQCDYLFKRPKEYVLEHQQEKIKRINLVEVTANIFQRYPSTQINIVSYYKGFPEVQNVKFFR